MQRTRDYRRHQFEKRRKRLLARYFRRSSSDTVIEGDEVVSVSYGHTYRQPLWRALRYADGRPWWWERDYDGRPYKRHGRRADTILQD